MKGWFHQRVAEALPGCFPAGFWLTGDGQHPGPSSVCPVPFPRWDFEDFYI